MANTRRPNYDIAMAEPPPRYKNFTPSIRANLPDYISDDIVAEINRHAERWEVISHKVGWNRDKNCGVAVFDYLDSMMKRQQYSLEFDQATVTREGELLTDDANADYDFGWYHLGGGASLKGYNGCCRKPTKEARK